MATLSGSCFPGCYRVFVISQNPVSDRFFQAVMFGNIAKPYFVSRKWLPYKIPLLTLLSKAKNNRICSHRMKSMIGETVKKGGFNHRQAKQQPANQDRTYPGFPRQDNPSGICILRTWMLFAGGQTKGPDRPGNPATKTVRVIPALSGKSDGYPGRFGL